MDGRGDDAGFAGGVGLERVEVRPAWTTDSLKLHGRNCVRNIYNESFELPLNAGNCRG